MCKYKKVKNNVDWYPFPSSKIGICQVVGFEKVEIINVNQLRNKCIFLREESGIEG